MSKQLVSRAILYTFIFGALFFFLNRMASHETISHTLILSVTAAVVFGVCYIALFSALTSPARKMKVGIILPITLILGIIIGQITNHMKIGIGAGLIAGLAIAFLWDFLSKDSKGESE
ncbi:hypothetical protein K2V61_09190 [Staphylococcus simulans]|uniref:hypothetical protein n=1 Tax=Staphylococcus simulans TaxID=1286 RepID=UPI000D03A552|nr:hypothetical protein [Staphylococcus simulans]MCD8915717.1 hypothetical protein [Staphylococcus simulans]